MNALSTADSALPSKSPARDYERVAAAIETLMTRSKAPSLAELAQHAGLSEFHFQRLFKRWAGVSPKQFMSYISVAHAKAVLERSASVLDAALEVGLSGPSRLHDLFLNVEAMTPGEYKAQGDKLTIRHATVETPFGRALMLATDKGICGFDFITGSDDAEALRAARKRWPLSHFVADPSTIKDLAARMFSQGERGTLPLLLRGTNFQIQVWSALLRVPSGAIVTYGDIGHAVACPDGSRAVGAALGANTIGYLVPCHRVLRSTGLFKDYRWGATRRYAMLGWEAAQRESQHERVERA